MEFIKYQSSYPLINRVKEQLHSFDSANLIESGEFYDWIKTEMQSLGLGYYRAKEEILEVKKYRAEVPKSFVSLYSIYRCGLSVPSLGVTRRRLPKTKESYVETCEADVTKKPCSSKFEYSGKRIIQVIHFPDVHQPIWENEYEVTSLLRYTNNVRPQLCDENCLNIGSKSKDEFTLDQNYFNFNFTDDHVYLQYYELPVDEYGLPEIPDIFSVKDAIERKIMYKLFEKWYLNGEGDMLQRMQYSEAKYKEAHLVALKEVKLPTYNELMNYALEQKDKFNIFHIESRAFGKNI